MYLCIYIFAYISTSSLFFFLQQIINFTNNFRECIHTYLCLSWYIYINTYIYIYMYITRDWAGLAGLAVEGKAGSVGWMENSIWGLSGN